MKRVNYSFTNMRTLLPLFINIESERVEDITEDMVWEAVIKDKPKYKITTKKENLIVHLDHLSSNKI